MELPVCITSLQNQNGIYKFNKSVERHLVTSLKFNGALENEVPQAAFCCSLVYAKPTLNFGLGKSVWDGNVDAIEAIEAIEAMEYLNDELKCYCNFHILHGEIFDKSRLDTLKDSISNLMNCQQTNVIKDQDKCDAEFIVDMLTDDGKQTAMESAFIRLEEFTKYATENCKLDLSESKTRGNKVAHFFNVLIATDENQGTETAFDN